MYDMVWAQAFFICYYKKGYKEEFYISLFQYFNKEVT